MDSPVPYPVLNPQGLLVGCLGYFRRCCYFLLSPAKNRLRFWLVVAIVVAIVVVIEIVFVAVVVAVTVAVIVVLFVVLFVFPPLP